EHPPLTLAVDAPQRFQVQAPEVFWARVGQGQVAAGTALYPRLYYGGLSAQRLDIRDADVPGT
ncbi:MAG: hypothetical protein ONB15_12340, partial [candidate division KSB1 bacterium]|nr:hypothetical protein [candidate division KSB1 bacterium]